MISAVDPDRIRAREIRSLVLADSPGQAMRSLAAGGTPIGVLIDRGRIASPVAAGADAVFAPIGEHARAPSNCKLGGP